MKFKFFIIAVIVLIFMAAGFAAAQEAFLEQLQQRLQNQEWEEGEIQNTIQACRKLNWEDTDPKHAEISALALQFGKDKDEALKPDEKAIFAHQIALQAGDMKKSGLDRKEIAGVVMKSTREMYRNLNRNRKMYDQETPGENIRECVEEAVRTQLRLMTADKVQAMDGTGDGPASGKNDPKYDKKGKKL